MTTLLLAACLATTSETPITVPGEAAVDATPEASPDVVVPTPRTASAGTPVPTPTPPPAPVAFGLLAPLSGAEAAMGLQARQGSELGLTLVNRQGGVLGRPLGLRIVDATGSREEVAQRYQALVHDGVAAVFAVTSNLQALQLSPHVRSAQVPTFMTAPNSTVGQQGIPWIIKLLPNEDRLARAAMSYARARLGANRIVVLYANDDFGVGSFRAAQLQLRDRYGAELTGAFPLSLDGANAAATLAQVRARNPDATLVFGRPTLLSVVMRQSKSQPTPGVFVTTSEATSLTAIDLFGANDASGWFAVTPIPPALRPTNLAREMVQAYRSAYRSEPDVLAAAHYDAMGIIAEAVRRARTVDPEPLLAAIRTIAAYDGVLGRYVFTNGGEGLQDIVTVRFEGRTLALVAGPS